MCRALSILMILAGFMTPDVGAQDIELTDRDLEQFEDLSAEREKDPAERSEPGEGGNFLTETTARYDDLIDQIKVQLRQVRIKLRELPLEVERARARLQSLRASEDDLRRSAYERVVFRRPHPVYEDFEEALDEALERQSIRIGLTEEIEANERAVERLEEERAALTRDLEQALRLKEEAREASLKAR